MSLQPANPILLDLPEQITGPRVLMRPFRPGDGAAVWEACGESRETLARWLPWIEQTTELSHSEAYVRQAASRWQTREDLPLGIWLRSRERFLGGTGLHRIRWEVPAFEIGYWLRRTEEGNGYMTEAVGMLTAFCFEKLGANRVEIRCDCANQRSAAVARRSGFVHEATLRNARRRTDGSLCDFLVFAMTPEDHARSLEAESAQ